MVLCCDQPRENCKTASLNGEVVIAAAVFHAAHFHHSKAAPLGTVIERKLLQGDNAIGDAVQLKIMVVRREIVEQQNGTAPTCKKILQGQNLPAVTQRALRQQPHLGKRVEDHAFRISFRDAVENVLRGLAEFHLSGVEQGELLLGVEARLGRDKLEDLNSGQRPAMPSRNSMQLACALRKRDIQATLPGSNTLQEELQRQSSLASARASFEEVHAVGIEAAAE